MINYLTRRLLALIPMLLIISILSFGIYQLSPGDPVRGFISLEEQNDPAAVERIRVMLGLDQPWYVQYFKWVGQAVQGNFGRSVISGEPVSEMILSVIPNTLQLTITAFIVGFTLAVAIGILSATRRYTFWDHATTLFGFAGIAIPTFFFGILLKVLFSVKLGWLPSFGRYTTGREGQIGDLMLHMIMPVIVMSINDIAGTSRFVRTSLLEVLRLDYVRTARAKGMGEKVVIYRHALRNAILPIVTLLGLGLPSFLGGALIAENMFGWPGMGRLIVGAVFQKDYNVIMAGNVMFAFLTITGNLTADILYTAVDPRVRFS
jgi:peptide/nickel transport system permease protein